MARNTVDVVELRWPVTSFLFPAERFVEIQSRATHRAGRQRRCGST